jgi:hypothetical protein
VLAAADGASVTAAADDSCSSPAFGAELPEEAAVIGAHEFLDQRPIIIELEDVDQVPFDPRARRGQRVGRQPVPHERSAGRTVIDRAGADGRSRAGRE